MQEAATHIPQLNKCSAVLIITGSCQNAMVSLLSTDEQSLC